MTLPDLTQFPVIACDAETTGLAWWKDKLFGLAFAWMQEGQLHSLYVDVRKPENMRWARDQLERARFVVNHHVKFDAHIWREAAIHVDPAKIDCTMIREALLDEHRHEYSLDSIAFDYLRRRKDESIWPKLAGVHGGKPTRDAQIGNLQFAPEDWVADYARPDAELALGIWMKQEDEIRRQELHQVLALERRLLGVVIDMERGGVRVNMDRAPVVSADLARRIEAEQRELNQLCGWDVNVNSNPQVHRIVRPERDEMGNWKAKDGTPLETTDGGAASVRTHSLHNMLFREAELIASIRGMVKAREVFIEKYILGMSHNGYIHASINQTKTDTGAGTGTGRFSITEPALQQIHKRDKKMAAVVRSLFLPDRGQVWGSYDWSQMDFRMFAHYVNQPVLLAAYESNPRTDFHGLVAEILGIPRDRNEKTGGGNAKQINLGLVFSMGQGRMCREMRLPYYVDERGFLRAGPEGEALFNKYHSKIPGVRRLRESAENVAKQRQYLWTPARRRLHFPGGYDAYKAAGLLFQAACADALKVKMCELHDRLKGTDSRLMLCVHDEQDVSMAGDVRQEEIVELLQRFDGVETPIQFRVPIICEAGQGMNWWEASQ